MQNLGEIINGSFRQNGQQWRIFARCETSDNLIDGAVTTDSHHNVCLGVIGALARVIGTFGWRHRDLMLAIFQFRFELFGSSWSFRMPGRRVVDNRIAEHGGTSY